MNWQVVIRESTRKGLRRFPSKDRGRILDALSEFIVNPYSGDTLKMEGGDEWRRRVGSYRIKYRIHEDERVVYIFEIKRRTSNTY